MAVTFDLPDEVIARLRAEADRRGVTVDELVAELVTAIPGDDTAVEERALGFVALGASTDGRNAVDADELLAEGFGHD